MKLETLTSLHIGSGNMLQKDSDFVFGKDAEDFSVVGVIDPRKVLALVGEENIDAWTVAIENGRSTNDMFLVARKSASFIVAAMLASTAVRMAPFMELPGM